MAEHAGRHRPIASHILEFFGLGLSPGSAVLPFVDLAGAPTRGLDSPLVPKAFSLRLSKTILLVGIQRQVKVDHRRVYAHSHGGRLRKVKDDAVDATAVDQKIPDEGERFVLTSGPAAHELAGLTSSDFWTGVKR